MTRLPYTNVTTTLMSVVTQLGVMNECHQVHDSNECSSNFCIDISICTCFHSLCL